MRRPRISDFAAASPASDVVSPYEPRPLQAVVHRDPHRLRLVVAHRRWGKSYLCAAEILNSAMTIKRRNMRLAPPRYAFIAPTVEMAKDLGFEPMVRFLAEWPHKALRGKEPRIEFESPVNPGITVVVKFIGAHSIDHERGRYKDGVVVDEFSEMPGSKWKAAIMPQLADYGGWGVVIGTPKGRNQFYQLYKKAKRNPRKWGVHYFPASETGIIPEDQLQFQREELGEDLFAQEFELKWMAAIQGSYYGKILNALDKENRLRNVPHDPDHMVSTSWDIGIHDHTVCWFIQRVAGEIRVIDHIEAANYPLHDAIQHVRERKDTFGRPYRYNVHYFPHDMRQREKWSGKSLEEMATISLRGWGTVKVVPRRPVQDGIEAVRRILPRCYFDEGKCGDGWDMLSLYRAKFDERLDTHSKPVKDVASHSADAFRTFAIMFEGKGEAKRDHDAEHGFDPSAPLDKIMPEGGAYGGYFPYLGRQR